MWVNCLDRNIFIKSLYSEVPHLSNAQIKALCISDEGNRVTLGFDMPYYAEFPPQKWLGLG